MSAQKLVISSMFGVRCKEESTKSANPEPRTPNQLGFTLIELLIVVSIIVILATIGVIIYGNVQKNARDAKRRADISSITKTLELARIKADLDTYPALDPSQFANTLPIDPGGKSYCASAVSSGAPAAVPGVWTSGDCSDVPNYSLVASGNPPAGTIDFRVCASLESGTVFCVSNQQ